MTPSSTVLRLNKIETVDSHSTHMVGSDSLPVDLRSEVM